MEEDFDENGRLQELVTVRLKHGERGVIHILLSNDIYVIEVFEEGDTSGVPLDMGCFVHISEIKALVKVVDGKDIEIPLETYEKTEPPFHYELDLEEP